MPIRTLMSSALSLAERGWHVFPCVPGGKRPALRGSWQDHATAEPARIRAWWGQVSYNIGIACGSSGLVVIDLDVPHGIGEISSAAAPGSAVRNSAGRALSGRLPAAADQVGRLADGQAVGVNAEIAQAGALVGPG
jgi:hypothetical protein